MTTINTVSGVTDSDKLGVTYMHEHIFVVNPEFQHYWPGYHGWDEEEYVEKARAALRRLHDESGVDTVLDPTVPGIGRNIRAVARAVEGTGLNVIVATGWYIYSEFPVTMYFRGQDEKIRDLTRLFMRDVEEGLEGTDIKPGVIKCSIDHPGLTPDVETLLRASARTHVQTGLPITTHSEASNESGLIQQEIFKREGVDMGAVVIGHCNQSGDLGYLERLIENGSFIGFDRCGLESPVANLEQQLDNLAELCRRGYADRIVLSHDNMVFLDWMAPGTYESLVRHFPYGFIHTETLPGLRERGVRDDDINTMLVENPRVYFATTRNGS